MKDVKKVNFDSTPLAAANGVELQKFTSHTSLSPVQGEELSRHFSRFRRDMANSIEPPISFDRYQRNGIGSLGRISPLKLKKEGAMLNPTKIDPFHYPAVVQQLGGLGTKYGVN